MPHHIPSHFSIQANPCSTHISWPCAQASTILCCLIFYTDYATTSMPGRHKMHACDSRMARLWHSILSCKPLAQIELDAARLHFRAQMACSASARLQCCSRAYTAVTMYQPMSSSTPTKHLSSKAPTQGLSFTANHVLCSCMWQLQKSGTGRLHQTYHSPHIILTTFFACLNQTAGYSALNVCSSVGCRVYAFRCSNISHCQHCFSRNRDD